MVDGKRPLTRPFAPVSSGRRVLYLPMAMSDIILPFGIFLSAIMYILPSCIIIMVPAVMGMAPLVISAITAGGTVLRSIVPDGVVNVITPLP